MYDLDKCILVTNNDRAAEKWKTSVKQIFLVNSYEEVLEKARDLIHTKCKLLTHPQASSLKPNQTPFRTLLLYDGGGSLGDVGLIEAAIETFEKWKQIKQIPKYSEKINYDYKTIDISMIENVIPKL